MNLTGRKILATAPATTGVRRDAVKRQGRPSNESGELDKHRGHGSTFEIDFGTGNFLGHFVTGHELVWSGLDLLKCQLVINAPNQLREFNRVFPELVGNYLPP